MIQMLEESGELDNKLIVVTSDNSMPFPRAKTNVYEYGIHMPLAVRWGKQVKGGCESYDLVSLIDSFATFLDVAGCAYPEYPVESRSLTNILASEKSGVVDSSRTAVFSSRERHSSSRWGNLGYPQSVMCTHDYLYIRNFRSERWPARAPQKYKQDGTLAKCAWPTTILTMLAIIL